MNPTVASNLEMLANEEEVKHLQRGTEAWREAVRFLGSNRLVRCILCDGMVTYFNVRYFRDDVTKVRCYACQQKNRTN